jgi:hypothetical protein
LDSGRRTIFEDILKDHTIAKLFSLAAGRCSICKTSLFPEDVKIGEMAHMIAKKRTGARGDIDFEGDLHSYENLILLCPNHHTVVDGDAAKYPLEKLRLIKANHESWVESSLKDYSKRHVDIAGLNALMRFLPFTRLRGSIEWLPSRLDLNFLYALSAIEAFPLDNPQCNPFSDHVLQNYYYSFSSRLAYLWEVADNTFPDKHCYVLAESGNGAMIINRALSYQERRSLENAVEHAATEFLPAYEEFMMYLRSNYPEVDITAFRDINP